MHPELQSLAEAAGILTSYYDGTGKLRESKPEALVQVLRILGIDIRDPEDAAAAHVRFRAATSRELVPPCIVAWDAGTAELALSVPMAEQGAFVIELALESGETRRIEGRLEHVAPRETTTVDGQTYVRRVVSLPVGVHGYHLARVEAGGRRGECFVISAPLSAYKPPAQKRWGVFAPLYGLHREGSTGIGDLADLMRLGRWVGELGGGFVGTLPLLASYLGEPHEYSPYGPVSRMFWNELYLDLASAPGMASSAKAQKAMASASFQAEAEALRKLPLVEYRRQMALRRTVLDVLSENAWETPALRSEMEAFLGHKTLTDEYARFRAVTERHEKVWRDWPERQRDGRIEPGDYDERSRRYHVYVQYAMEQQLSQLSQGSGVTLYLDLPVGVHRYGYDTWRYPQVFASGAAAGAPPDPLFSEGQNWGGSPPHPWGLRKTHYRYFIESVRAHLEHAGMLRIDHALGLHRMYWVPEGASAKDGLYVHYNAGEMYAILSLESHRARCAVTGEDLGTVPDYVRPSMQRHGLSRLYVGQFSVPDREDAPIVEPPHDVVASINTHDTPTWAGFWRGDDIEVRVGMGLLDREEAEAEHAGRRATLQRTAAYLCAEGFLAAGEEDDGVAVMRAFTAFLAASPAELVIVTLEDLWMEASPQNVPGTSPDERPNWRRKLVPTLERILADQDARGILAMVAQTRARTIQSGGRGGATTGDGRKG
jgi:4-alpha-glucanotransferase